MMSLSDRTVSSRKSRSRTDLTSSHSSAVSLSISDNVRLMQDSLQLLFSERDRLSIVQILEDFHRDRDVALFVENLRPYIDSPIKVKHFLPCLRRVFPRAELVNLDKRLREIGVTNGDADRPESRATLTATPLPDDAAASTIDSSTLTRSTFEPDPADLAPYRPPAARYSWVDRYGRSVSPPPNPPVHRAADLLSFALRVPPGRSLGVSVRGGAEFGLGVFVATVDAGSQAALAGLAVGDQILRVNGRETTGVRHEEAVRLLHRHAARLEIEVWRVGRLPFARAAGEGRVIDQFQLFSAGSLGRNSELTISREMPRETMTLGRETVTSRETPRETMTLGRGLMTPRETPREMLTREKMTPREALMPGKEALTKPGALGRLSGQERETLAYYMDEYREKTIGVDDLVLALSQMTQGREGFEDLSRLLRGWIRPEDVDRYTLLTSLHDELTALRLRKEEKEKTTSRPQRQSRKNTPRECASSGSDASCGYARSPVMEKRSSCSDSVDELKEPEGRRSRADVQKGKRVSTPSRSASSATEMRLSRAIRDIEETGLSDDSGVDSSGQRHQGRQRRSPKLQDAGVCTEPRQQRDAGTLTEEAPVRDRERVIVDKSVSAQLGMSVEGGAGSKQPLPRIINVQLPADGKLVIATPQGRPTALIDGPTTARVSVQTVAGRSRPKRLGLAIQGGADIEGMPFPEIAHLESGGAAEATGRLFVGQTILEVNGKSLEGVTHNDAAQMIARAFRNPEVATMELVVMDPGKDKS